MALEFIDSCGMMGAYSSDSAQAPTTYRKYTLGQNCYGGAAQSFQIRRSGSFSLRLEGGSAYKTLQYKDTRIVGCACYIPNHGSTGSRGGIIGFSSGGTALATLYLEPDNSLTILSEPNGVVVFNSGSVPYYLTIGQYHYFEISCALSGATPITGTFTLKIDGNTIASAVSNSLGINASSLLSGAATMNEFGLILNSLATPTYYQDIYVLNSDTTDINGHTTTLDTFLGDVEIDAIFPDADASPNDFTQGAGGFTYNYQFVAGNPATDDSSYLYDDTVTDGEDYNMTPITGFTGTLLGAQLCVYARKDAEGSRAFEALLNATPIANLFGTNQYLYDWYDYFLYPLDSDNGSAWTPALFNAADFGVEITV